MGGEGGEQGAVGQFTPRAGEAGGEQQALGVEGVDHHPHPVLRRLDLEIVVERHVHEGRDVQALDRALADLGSAVFHRDQVGVALAEGGADLVQDRGQPAVRTVAEVEAKRVEDVAQHPR